MRGNLINDESRVNNVNCPVHTLVRIYQYGMSLLYYESEDMENGSIYQFFVFALLAVLPRIEE